MMNKNQTLLELLEEVLGRYKEYPKQNEVAFNCPICNHKKKKLQVNVSTGAWHCWVCQIENDMAGKSLFSLFKKVNASSKHFARLKEILGFRSDRPTQTTYQKTDLVLPSEFVSLSVSSASPQYKRAVAYLKGRGVTQEDVLRYNIGYAEYGEYKDMIIIPSYDAAGKINFFTSRTFTDNYMKFKNPSWSKNVIGFEAYINWSYPIVLVEGAFDAIAVRVNAIPLFGKTIPDILRHTILERNVENIYISLDSDARQSISRHIQTFMGEGRSVYFVDLPITKDVKYDPSKLGFEKMRALIESAPRATLKTIVQLRMS